MKFHLLLEKNSEEYGALSEVLTELGHELCDDGLAVAFRPREKGVRVFGDQNGATVEYADRTSLMRGAGLLVRYAKEESFDVTQTPAYDTLGTMPDISRNAVLTVEGVKRMCRYTALMGFNAMLLYAEDIYEVEDEPFFGHMRGRYSARELREMDDYADMLGVELIPGIQTLAHLEPIFHWPTYQGMRDVDDILNVSHPRTYEFIEHLIASLTKNLRTRRINIGMDEAYLLGRGKYLVENGYHTITEIMQDHLAKVVAICKKYGQHPRMWSDMFIRMATPDESYRHPQCNITPEIIATVPEEVTLVFWDYYAVDRERYDRQFRNHMLFNNDIAFAGGDSGWYSLVPLNVFSVNAARAALASAREFGMKEVYTTMWRNHCLVSSHFSVLPTWVLYGEDCWSKDTGDENLRQAMMALTNCSYDAFMNMEQIENLPGRTDLGKVLVHAAKYMFWQDPLVGAYDAHVPEGAGKHFAACREMLKAQRRQGDGSFGYIFDTLESCCHVLEIKAEVGIGLKAAYDAKDNAGLEKYRDEILPELLSRVESFYDTYRVQWEQENRAFGWDVQDIALGGLQTRIKTAIRRLDGYLAGKYASLEELEAPRLPLAEPHPTHGVLLNSPRWRSIVTPGIM